MHRTLRIEPHLLHPTNLVHLRTWFYGIFGGGTRRLVACSNAYASSIRRPSVHAVRIEGNGRVRYLFEDCVFDNA